MKEEEDILKREKRGKVEKGIMEEIKAWEGEARREKREIKEEGRRVGRHGRGRGA